MRAFHLHLIALCAFASAVAGAPASTQEVEAIRALERRQESAWNEHDAHAYSQLFSVDADTVNVLGWWGKSRVELEQELGKGFNFVFARSGCWTPITQSCMCGGR